MKKKSRRQTFVTTKKHSIFFLISSTKPSIELYFDQCLLSHGVDTASFLHPRTNHIIGTLRQRRHPAIQPDDGTPCSPPDSPHSPSSQDSQKPQQKPQQNISIAKLSAVYMLCVVACVCFGCGRSPCNFH